MSSFIEIFQKAGAIVDGAVAGYDIHVLTPVGLNLFMAMAAFVVSWRGVKIAMGSSEARALSSLMNEFLKTIFGVSIVFFLLTTGFDMVFVQGVDGSLKKVSGLLLPGGMGGGAISTSIASMYEGLNAVSKMMSDLFKDASVLDTLTVFFKNLPTILVLGFVEILIIVGIVAYFSLISLSFVMVKIALVIAPIFIPWLLLPATSFVFMGWLRFLISASLYQVIGATVIYFSQSLLTNTAKLIAETGGTFPESLFAAIAMAALQVTILALIIKVPQIAKQLSMGQKLDVFESFKTK
ncbi:MAG: type IV secretion system protein [Methylotenera sp.]|uniref:type IV secretion system protein n=1 Tax=Methylotenera sp. TaxID=2051956 RepID=UPI00271B8BEB|nr:type IV secretion system protein [Methylotenera sp.]MDO9393198.1 type IV secretion system protein [Methylotenera sp.]